MMQPKLVIDHVSKQFGEVSALEDISLTLEQNEFMSIVGRSGCGKSTLLSIIGGLEEPSSGQVFVDGREVTGPGRDRGVVFQRPTLLPWLSALANIEFALQPLPKRERRSTALHYLDQVGLTQFADAYPAELSGGMQQPVALARSLSYQPDILLMDEPFGALDALTRRVMQELLTEIWEHNKLTVVLVTHDIEEAIYTSDRVLVMTARPGRVHADIAIELARPRMPAVSVEDTFREYYADLLGMIEIGTFG